MIEIHEKSECCGCTACENICPKKCIEMRPDEEGFLYPWVNKEQCIQCGLCDKVCPIQKSYSSEEGEPSSFVVRTKNPTDLLRSTSGGFTTPLAEWVFQNKGVVFAVGYDEKFQVVHKAFFENDDEFKKTKGSKYVQSSLKDCFWQVKKYLEEERMVCFIGTTCQVYGLLSFLGEKKENLITVDLVCHGVPSPLLWDKYLQYQTKKYRSDIEDINFRNKTYGYHSGTMRIKFKNGKVYTGSARVDYMLKSFFSEISSRPSCYDCAFKFSHRISDFTIYDCWHASYLVQGLEDDDKGYTNVMVNSDDSMCIWEKIKDCYEYYPVNSTRAVKADGVMVQHSAVPHKSRWEYYDDIDKLDIQKICSTHIRVSFIDRILEASKRVFYNIGWMEKIRRIKKRK